MQRCSVSDMLTNAESLQVSCSSAVGLLHPFASKTGQEGKRSLTKKKKKKKEEHGCLLTSIYSFGSSRERVRTVASGTNPTLVTTLCGPRPLLAQDILISSSVVGLLFHRGRGLVSGTLCEPITDPLGLCWTSSDSNC